MIKMKPKIISIKKGAHGRKKLNRSVGGNAITFFILFVLAIFTAIPMVYAIVNAFKPLDELWIYPPKLYVMNPTWKNFKDLSILMASSWVPFARYLFNTLFITVAGSVGNIICASLCAYPLAKDKFPGSKLFFRIVVLSLMFTAAVTAVPSYVIMSKLKWIDSYKAIIIPALGSSLGLFLMKQFMEQVPTALIEAASIDGASHWYIFWHIMMPNVKPAWLTLAIFSVQSLWNIGQTNYIYSEELKTLPYALAQVVTGGIARTGVAAAISVIMMIVPITMFIVSQAQIIETMSSAGIKE